MKKNLWMNENKEEIIKFYITIGSFSKTSKEFNKSKESIANLIKSNLKNWKKFQKKTDILWTKEDLDILSKYPIISLKEIATLLNRTYSSVRAKALISGISLENKSLSAKETAKRNNQEIWDKSRIIKEIKENYSLLESHSDALLKFPKLYDAASRYFGSWKEAIIQAGFDYFSLSYETRYFIGLDNGGYDSRSECIIGNFLFLLKQQGKIKNYKAHKRVCEERKWLCDFYIDFYNNDSLWLEYDGLKEIRYNKNLYLEKLDYYLNNNYNYISIRGVNPTIKHILSILELENEYNKWIKDKIIFKNTFNLNYENHIKNMLNDVNLVYAKIGKVPTSSQYSKYGSFDITTLYRHIGIWKEILEEAGLWDKYEKKRLSIEKVKEIKREIKKGKKCKEIAKELNVSLSCVNHIYFGDRWINVSIDDEVNSD